MYNAVLESMSVVVDAQSGKLLDLYGDRRDKRIAESLVRQFEPLCGSIVLQLRGAISTTRGYQNAAPNNGFIRISPHPK